MKTYDEYFNRKKANCLSCQRYIAIKARGMCQNCHHKDKRKTDINFFLRTRYTEMLMRVSQPNKPQSKYYFGLSICSREEFLNKFLNCQEFLEIFKNWQLSNFEYRLAPSIDRVDGFSGYDLNNIHFIIHGENSIKAHAEAVYAISYETGECFYFESLMEASRHLNLHQRNMWATLKGLRRSCGGYYFEYA